MIHLARLKQSVMIILNDADVNALLEQIDDPKVKKAIETLLRDLQNNTVDPSKPVDSILRKERLAKKALNVICIELIKHAGYSAVLHELLRLLD